MHKSEEAAEHTNDHTKHQLVLQHPNFNSIFTSNIHPTLTTTVQKKNTIHQLIIMLSISKNVLFPGLNHL